MYNTFWCFPRLWRDQVLLVRGSEGLGAAGGDAQSALRHLWRRGARAGSRGRLLARTQQVRTDLRQHANHVHGSYKVGFLLWFEFFVATQFALDFWESVFWIAVLFILDETENGRLNSGFNRHRKSRTFRCILFLLDQTVTVTSRSYGTTSPPKSWRTSTRRTILRSTPWDSRTITTPSCTTDEWVSNWQIHTHKKNLLWHPFWFSSLFKCSDHIVALNFVCHASICVSVSKCVRACVCVFVNTPTFCETETKHLALLCTSDL